MDPQTSSDSTTIATHDSPPPPPDLQPTFSDLLDQPELTAMIAFNCTASAALAFSACSPRAPRFRLVTQLLGESRRDWQGPASVYSALRWQPLAFDSPPSRLHTVFLACNWNDQGWGNRKGMLSVVRGDKRAPGDYQRWPKHVVAGREPAPHALTPLRLSFRPESDPAGGWQPYHIAVRVGGGGGHSLHVRDLVVRELSLAV